MSIERMTHFPNAVSRKTSFSQTLAAKAIIITFNKIFPERNFMLHAPSPPLIVRFTDCSFPVALKCPLHKTAF